MDSEPKTPIIEIKNLKKYYPIKGGFFGKQRGIVKAVDDVSLTLYKGETLGLVGESGCGKTTLGRCVMRALQPTAGQLLYYNEDGSTTDLANLAKKALYPYRAKLRMICQDPYSSLNPRMNVLDLVGEPLKILKHAGDKEIEAKVSSLLQRVGLRPEYLHRYPHAFSGGQRQRIGIAHAIAVDPTVIVADESVSALDVSVRAQIIELFQELGRDLGLTYLFISHDLSVVEYIADRVAVMYVGRLVELAPTEELFGRPRHPYTEALMSAVPRADPRNRSQRILLQGDIPSPANPPTGCYFHPRCRYAQEICQREAPALAHLGGEHYAACHFSEELTLKGVAL
jgi:peptide/nickel transport system ATP-binding protein